MNDTSDTNDASNTNQPKWLAESIQELSFMPGLQKIDRARRKMARTILYAAEVGDPQFPTPRVFADVAGHIHLDWQACDGQPEGPATLEFVISRAISYRAAIWRPGQTATISVVTENFAEHARRLFFLYWPYAHVWTLQDMLELTEVRR